MTIASTRSYTILAWLLPVFIFMGARDLLWAKIESVWSHIDAANTLSEQIRGTGVHVRELPEMKRDYENLARKKMAISSSLFGAASEAGLYELLMLKAREADVSILTVAPLPRRTNEGFIEQPITLKATGSYNGLARFTNSIECVNRLMRVESLDMEKDRTGILTEEVKLVVYMYSDTLTAQGAKSPKGSRSSGAQEGAFQTRESYLADLYKALNVAIVSPKYSYSASVKGDPFGTIASKTSAQPGKGGAEKKETFGFALKGILWKDPPLAILESLDGKTYIVKQGESVNGFTISSISRTDVVVTTPQGEHVLHEYDQK